jgi:hypothetical protein
VPHDRALALQKAFMTTLAEKHVIAEATQMGLGITPVSGPDVAVLVDRIYNAPEAALEYLRKIIKE